MRIDKRQDGETLQSVEIIKNLVLTALPSFHLLTREMETNTNLAITRQML